MSGGDWKADAEAGTAALTNALARAETAERRLGQIRGDNSQLRNENDDLQRNNTALSEMLALLAHAPCEHRFPTVYVAVTLDENGEVTGLDVLDHAPVLFDIEERIFVTNINSGVFMPWTPPHEPGGNTDECRIPNCPQCAAAERVKS